MWSPLPCHPHPTSPSRQRGLVVPRVCEERIAAPIRAFGSGAKCGMMNGMDMLLQRVEELAIQLGIGVCVELDPRELVPEERIREYCYENKCGNYGNHYMCPPHVGAVEDIRRRLARYRRGVLLQYSQPLDVRNDWQGLLRTKTDFQRKVLRLEEFLRNEGHTEAWGMMGGSCTLCDACKAKTGEPCPYPGEARASLESLAIDVLALLAKRGLDNEFRPDRITWTGCVLF